uniref:Uncharacterized protein n=1 Tax=Romanomermis culicivorax TaxID=13658 RepID=A0A915JWM3_ROMCU
MSTTLSYLTPFGHKNIQASLIDCMTVELHHQNVENKALCCVCCFVNNKTNITVANYRTYFVDGFQIYWVDLSANDLIFDAPILDITNNNKMNPTLTQVKDTRQMSTRYSTEKTLEINCRDKVEQNSNITLMLTKWKIEHVNRR